MDADPAALEVVVAPADWDRIDIVSDLHLSADTPRTFEAFGRFLFLTAADAVILLGDIFEAWIGDDARLEGFEAEATAVLSKAAARKALFFMAGNRDFLVGDQMLAACGIRGLADPTVVEAWGERALLTHGDAWCLGDVEYLGFRARVRDPRWQAQVLSKPLAERRQMARGMRSESEKQFATGLGVWHDIDLDTARTSLAGAGAVTLVHGHTHHPGSVSLGPGLMRHVTSDWDLDHATPARAEVLRWQRNGWHRLALADAGAPLATPG